MTIIDEQISELSFLWLEITGKCQLRCVHCYADSGPSGTHGAMESDDWRRVIDDGVTLGVRMVQFIGGEPTTHPAFACLTRYALDAGLAVEIFTNLVHVSSSLWSVFSIPGVRLATSYYTDRAGQHEAITGRKGSHSRTMANISEAVRRSIPLRVGLIDIEDGQRIEQARRQLENLGVVDVNVDFLRQVGRGVRDQVPSGSQLCGSCGDGKVAVSTGGDVWPCVFSRWASIGNVRATPLVEIVTRSRLLAVRAQLGMESSDVSECAPKKTKCSPESQCQPAKSPCQPHCPPGYHSEPKRCWPYYYEERHR